MRIIYLFIFSTIISICIFTIYVCKKYYFDLKPKNYVYAEKLKIKTDMKTEENKIDEKLLSTLVPLAQKSVYQFCEDIKKKNKRYRDELAIIKRMLEETKNKSITNSILSIYSYHKQLIDERERKNMEEKINNMLSSNNLTFHDMAHSNLDALKLYTEKNNNINVQEMERTSDEADVKTIQKED